MLKYEAPSSFFGHLREFSNRLQTIPGLDDPLKRLVLGQFVRRHVAQVLIDPVRHQPPMIRVWYQSVLRFSSSHACEVFHLSLISWSSNIIDVGSVESIHRTTGSLQASQ